MVRKHAALKSLDHDNDGTIDLAEEKLQRVSLG